MKDNRKPACHGYRRFPSTLSRDKVSTPVAKLRCPPADPDQVESGLE